MASTPAFSWLPSLEFGWPHYGDRRGRSDCTPPIFFLRSRGRIGEPWATLLEMILRIGGGMIAVELSIGSVKYSASLVMRGLSRAVRKRAARTGWATGQPQ